MCLCCARLGWAVKVMFVQFSHLGGKWMPRAGNVNVCPRGVGVSASTSFLEPSFLLVGASGIPPLPYENVDVYSDFMNPDNNS